MAPRPKSALSFLAPLLVTALGLLVLTVPAAARVSVSPGETPGGGVRTFSFRFTNERPDVFNNRIELVFPHSPPIASAEVAAAPGWTASVQRRPAGESVSSIVLEGGALGPGAYEQFEVTMGPLPQNDTLVLEAAQSFTDGTVDRWSEPPAAGQTSAAAPVIVVGSGVPPRPGTPPDPGAPAPSPGVPPVSGPPAPAPAPPPKVIVVPSPVPVPVPPPPAPVAPPPAGEAPVAPGSKAEPGYPVHLEGAAAGSTGVSSSAVRWGALFLAVLAVFGLAYRTRLRGR